MSSKPPRCLPRHFLCSFFPFSFFSIIYFLKIICILSLSLQLDSHCSAHKLLDPRKDETKIYQKKRKEKIIQKAKIEDNSISKLRSTPKSNFLFFFFFFFFFLTNEISMNGILRYFNVHQKSKLAQSEAWRKPYNAVLRMPRVR